MKTLQPLPCRLHPKDKVVVARLEDNLDEKWEVTCRNASCQQIGVSRHHAITRWNDAQQEIERSKV